MVQEPRGSNRRMDFRLPFHEKVIFTDGNSGGAAYAVNISRGGMFVATLDPMPIDGVLRMAFCFPNQMQSFCAKAKVAHIIYDRQGCEIDCGMGFQFLELNEAQKSVLNLHIVNEQTAYLDLKKLLIDKSPNASDISTCLKGLSCLRQRDLLDLRYRVNRICTIFEPAPTSHFHSGTEPQKITA